MLQVIFLYTQYDSTKNDLLGKMHHYKGVKSD